MYDEQTIVEQELPPHFVTSSGQTALEWMAVISSLGGDYFAEYSNGNWAIFTPPEQFNYFDKQISEYESERILFDEHNNACSCYTPVNNEISYSAVHVALLLLIIHLFSGTSEMNGPLIQVGVLSIAELFNGEWWRAITALTLHGDIEHMLSNAIFLVVFAPHLCRSIGSSLTWLLILFSGVAGNITTCFFYEIPHRSLGSSTSVFGALGLLAGLAVIHKLKERQTKLAYKAFIAGIAMLALTGLNIETDVLAHIFGFIYGFIFASCGYFFRDKITLKLKILIWIITIGTLIYAWHTAISNL